MSSSYFKQMENIDQECIARDQCDDIFQSQCGGNQNMENIEGKTQLMQLSSTMVSELQYFDEPSVTEVLQHKTMDDPIESEDDEEPLGEHQSSAQIQMTYQSYLSTGPTNQVLVLPDLSQYKSQSASSQPIQNKGENQDDKKKDNQQIKKIEQDSRRTIKAAKKNCLQYYAGLIYLFFNQDYNSLNEQEQQLLEQLKRFPTNNNFELLFGCQGAISDGLSTFFEKKRLWHEILNSKVRTSLYKFVYKEKGHFLRKKFIKCQKQLGLNKTN